MFKYSINHSQLCYILGVSRRRTGEGPVRVKRVPSLTPTEVEVIEEREPRESNMARRAIKYCGDESRTSDDLLKATVACGHLSEDTLNTFNMTHQTPFIRRIKRLSHDPPNTFRATQKTHSARLIRHLRNTSNTFHRQIPFARPSKRFFSSFFFFQKTHHTPFISCIRPIKQLSQDTSNTFHKTHQTPSTRHI